MPDPFEHHAAGLESPASHGFVITPHDSTPMPQVTRAIYVGGAGTVCVRMQSDAELSLIAVPAGSVLPLRARLVKQTGTTATGLVGLV